MELRPHSARSHGGSPHRWSSSRCTIHHRVPLPGTPLSSCCDPSGDAMEIIKIRDMISAIEELIGLTTREHSEMGASSCSARHTMEVQSRWTWRSLWRSCCCSTSTPTPPPPPPPPPSTVTKLVEWWWWVIPLMLLLLVVVGDADAPC